MSACPRSASMTRAWAAKTVGSGPHSPRGSTRQSAASTAHSSPRPHPEAAPIEARSGRDRTSRHLDLVARQPVRPAAEPRPRRASLRLPPRARLAGTGEFGSRTRRLGPAGPGIFRRVRPGGCRMRRSVSRSRLRMVSSRGILAGRGAGGAGAVGAAPWPELPGSSGRPAGGAPCLKEGARPAGSVVAPRQPAQGFSTSNKAVRCEEAQPGHPAEKIANLVLRGRCPSTGAATLPIDPNATAGHGCTAVQTCPSCSLCLARLSSPSYISASRDGR